LHIEKSIEEEGKENNEILLSVTWRSTGK